VEFREPKLKTQLSFGQNITSIPVVSNGDWGQYLIVLSPSQDARRLGVDVETYVVFSNSIPRNRYLRQVTLDTFLEYGEDLYADLEDEPFLQTEFVNTTLVSGVCEFILGSVVLTTYLKWLRPPTIHHEAMQ
jgi:hypothetical protein